MLKRIIVVTCLLAVILGNSFAQQTTLLSNNPFSYSSIAVEQGMVSELAEENNIFQVEVIPNYEQLRRTRVRNAGIIATVSGLLVTGGGAALITLSSGSGSSLDLIGNLMLGVGTGMITGGVATWIWAGSIALER